MSRVFYLRAGLWHLSFSLPTMRLAMASVSGVALRRISNEPALTRSSMPVPQ